MKGYLQMLSSTVSTSEWFP